MDLNINFLKTFYNLSQSGSYTQTAKNLHMTQPGVSQHVKWLEEYFNTSLIEKQGRSFQFTIAGEKVLSYAEDTFSKHQDFLNSFKVDDPYTGSCKIASPGSFGMRMYSFLLKYNKKYPGLAIIYQFTPNKTIEKELLSNEIDMGFMEYRPKNSLLQSKEFTQEKLCLVAPTSLKDISFKGLAHLGFIQHPDGFDQAEQVLSLNYPNEFQGMENITVSGGNNHISRILEPVSLGIGFTVLPEYACLAYPKQNKIQYIPLKKEIVRTIYLVHRKTKLPSRFMALVNAFEQQL